MSFTSNLLVDHRWAGLVWLVEVFPANKCVSSALQLLISHSSRLQSHRNVFFFVSFTTLSCGCGKLSTCAAHFSLFQRHEITTFIMTMKLVRELHNVKSKNRKNPQPGRCIFQFCCFCRLYRAHISARDDE